MLLLNDKTKGTTSLICFRRENDESIVKDEKQVADTLVNYVRHIDSAKAQDSIEKINPRKSCGWDTGMPPKLLKKVATGIAPSLTYLYNRCNETGDWPGAWKKGELTPATGCILSFHKPENNQQQHSPQ